MTLRTTAIGMTVETVELRKPRPPYKGHHGPPVGLTVRSWHGFGAVCDRERVLAVFPDEREAEMALRDGRRWEMGQRLDVLERSA